ncbi:hypothetical protein B7494_g5042 [Chlorociboria aeruginascens]|nr:hypothetical protein B7494_g5042 [Chlorociboria aeruginascens]
MGSVPGGFPVSLRSWPSSDSNSNSDLPTIIARINAERGFLNLTEEGLRQEIADEEAGLNRAEDSSSSDDEDEEHDRAKELATARQDMLEQIDKAHQAAMQSLEFVSLLLSKDIPTQATVSISQQLRDLVGVGTLAADKTQTSRTTEEQKKDNYRVVKGWKIQNLNKSVDSILASATRLEKEIELETKYWEHVLAISDKGWALCRLPNEKHILGVRYGFSEAAPAFKDRSLAELRRNPDGSIILEQGVSSSQPQYLRVQVSTNGVDTGECSVPQYFKDNAPIEDLILQARNSIFVEELWHEINREARTNGSYGVRSKDSTLIFPLSPTKSAILSLVPISDAFPPSSRPDDPIAEAVSLALHLLLSYSHRISQHRRTRPPAPLSDQKRNTPPSPLLRSLITRLNHTTTTSTLHIIVSSLCSTLTSTAVSPSPSYTLIPTIPQAPPSIPPAEHIISTLIDRLETICTLALSASTTITIHLQTRIFPVSIPLFLLSISSSSPLRTICPAPPVLQTVDAVKEYLFYATSCFLASSLSNAQEQNANGPGDHHPPNPETPCSAPGLSGWHLTSQPHITRKIFAEQGKGKQIAFEVFESSQKEKSGGVRIEMRWEWQSDSSPEAGDTKDESKLDSGEGRYEWFSSKDGERNGWDGAGEGEVVRGLVDVVEEAGKWGELS